MRFIKPNGTSGENGVMPGTKKKQTNVICHCLTVGFLDHTWGLTMPWETSMGDKPHATSNWLIRPGLREQRFFKSGGQKFSTSRNGRGEKREQNGQKIWCCCLTGSYIQGWYAFLVYCHIYKFYIYLYRY